MNRKKFDELRVKDKNRLARTTIRTRLANMQGDLEYIVKTAYLTEKEIDLCAQLIDTVTELLEVFNVYPKSKKGQKDEPENSGYIPEDSKAL